MRKHGLRSVRSPPRRRYKGGKPAVVAPNRLQRQFNVEHPDRAWVTDITYLRTAEGWLYLAVVIDLYSRAVIGWSMKSSLARELAMDALLMAIWRRRPVSAYARWPLEAHCLPQRPPYRSCTWRPEALICSSWRPRSSFGAWDKESCHDHSWMPSLVATSSDPKRPRCHCSCPTYFVSGRTVDTSPSRTSTCHPGQLTGLRSQRKSSAMLMSRLSRSRRKSASFSRMPKDA